MNKSTKSTKSTKKYKKYKKVHKNIKKYKEYKKYPQKVPKKYPKKVLKKYQKSTKKSKQKSTQKKVRKKYPKKYQKSTQKKYQKKYQKSTKKNYKYVLIKYKKVPKIKNSTIKLKNIQKVLIFSLVADHSKNLGFFTERALFEYARAMRVVCGHIPELDKNVMRWACLCREMEQFAWQRHRTLAYYHRTPHLTWVCHMTPC